MNKPRLLDLFCGAGGASRGYYDAGFEVVGVDIAPQPHYPYTFIQADAMTFPLDGYDAIHASPPCQEYSCLHAVHPDRLYSDLLATIRTRLQTTRKPYAIENVTNAPFQHGILLCGSMFGLRVLRHRTFESNLLLYAPGPCQHNGSVKTGEYVTVCGNGGGKHKSPRLWPVAMGIDWMNKRELSQAVPPAYTKWIGPFLMDYVPCEKMLA